MIKVAVKNIVGCYPADKLFYLQYVPLWEGSIDGTEVRTLASHQCDLGSIHRHGIIGGLSLLLVLSFALRVFTGFSGFPSYIKTNSPNSNLIWNQKMNSHSVDVTLQIPIYLFIFIYLFVFKM